MKICPFHGDFITNPDMSRAKRLCCSLNTALQLKNIKYNGPLHYWYAVARYNPRFVKAVIFSPLVAIFRHLHAIAKINMNCLKCFMRVLIEFKSFIRKRRLHCWWGWSGGAMVLGKLPVPGRPTIWITVGQGPTALAVGAGGGLFGHFYSHLSFLSSFSLSLGDGPI